MDQLSKIGQKFTSVWSEFTHNKWDFHDPSAIVICLVSSVATILAICVAWSYTRRKQSRVIEKYSVKDKAAAAENDADVGGVEDINKLPSACPLSHMYHMSKMSQLTTATKQDTETSGDTVEGIEEGERPSPLDNPGEYISHIQSAVKRSQQRVAVKKLEEDMSEEQKQSERETQRKQLEAIFSLLEDQKDKFGIDDIDDMNNQVKLYM